MVTASSLLAISRAASGLFLIRKELQDLVDHIQLAPSQFLALRPVYNDRPDMNRWRGRPSAATRRGVGCARSAFAMHPRSPRHTGFPRCRPNSWKASPGGGTLPHHAHGFRSRRVHSQQGRTSRDRPSALPRRECAGQRRVHDQPYSVAPAGSTPGRESSRPCQHTHVLLTVAAFMAPGASGADPCADFCRSGSSLKALEPLATHQEFAVTRAVGAHAGCSAETACGLL